jgi:hypothetical protein
MQPATLRMIVGGTRKGRRHRRRPDRRNPGARSGPRSWFRSAIRCRSRGVAVDFSVDAAGSRIRCTARVETRGRTGVEMEALTAVQVGLLTFYDMCKAVDRGMVIGEIRVLEKHGGKSGDWTAEAGYLKSR